jgi:3-oxoacyl-[acyl-carrier protein] reductase
LNRLKGKTALITGAARGIGAAIATRFAEEGARVIINDLALPAAQEMAARIDGAALAADVSNAESVRGMFVELGRLTDRLDILVNNAGISGIEGDNDAPARIQRRAEALARGEATLPREEDEGILGVADQQWERMLAVHLGGTFHCSREAVRLMRSGGMASGSMINMGSIMGTFGRSGGVAYSAAKAGILGFTRALAHELAPDDIRVNAIAPGWIRTDMTAPLGPMVPFLEQQTPLGRMGEPDDIAWCAVYLASDEAAFVTGQTLSPNGGWYMSQ